MTCEDGELRRKLNLPQVIDKLKHIGHQNAISFSAAVSPLRMQSGMPAPR